MPFATDSEILIPEKLPGPIFTIIEKFLSILAFFSFIKLNILFTSESLFLILGWSFLTKKLLSTLKAIESFLPVKLIIKKSFIIILFIVFLIDTNNSYSQSKSIGDYGIISIMYHRFDENKYPSTNIKIEDFKSHINLIKDSNFKFISHKEFEESLNKNNLNKKILLTIDDAFSSFYVNAWPYIKENKIPFILFVSTETVGKNGYMNWEQIIELENEDFAFIGNHSHSHKYLIDYNLENFSRDINKSINIFEKKIGYNPIFFSYPFGEYSLEQKKFISENFLFAFGQHSGVIDLNKDRLELPRFPINEKYGDLNRFDFLTKLLPLQYNKIYPNNKLLKESNNPPNMYIEFFEDQKNIGLVKCFSNEGGEWRDTYTELIKNKLNIIFKEKFIPRRGRINCSLNDKEGWRWLGIQFIIS